MWPMLIVLAAKLAQGYFEKKSAEKKAKAVKTADELRYEAENKLWNANEAQRGTKIDLASNAIRNVQPSLGPGAPNYNLDAALLNALKAPRPFGGSKMPDPTAGLGYQYLAGLTGDIGSFAGGAYQAAQTKNFWDDWSRTQNSLLYDNPFGPGKPAGYTYPLPTGKNYGGIVWPPQ